MAKPLPGGGTIPYDFDFSKTSPNVQNPSLPQPIKPPLNTLQDENHNNIWVENNRNIYRNANNQRKELNLPYPVPIGAIIATLAVVIIIGFFLFVFHGITTAYKKNPNYYDTTYNDRGIKYAENNNYNQAIKEFTKGIKRYPNELTCYFNRALAYYNIGDYDKAIADFNEVIRIDPSYTKAYEYREQAYSEKKK